MLVSFTPELAPGQPATDRAAEPSPARLPAAPAATTAPPTASLSSPEPALVRRAAEMLDEYAQKHGRNLEFSVDEDSGVVVIRVVNAETGELDRQIPAEESLVLARALEGNQGMILRQQA